MDRGRIGAAVAHGMFILTAALYSSFWVVQDTAPYETVAALFNGSLLLGFLAMMGTLGSIVGALLSGKGPPPRLWPPIAITLTLLLATGALSSWLIGREFTSELPFVGAWAMVELIAIRVSEWRDWLTPTRVRLAERTVWIALVMGLVAYAIYFQVEGTLRFFVGLAPYLTVILAMSTAAALLLKHKPPT